jgi:hydrogenase nickel incorporation protein HypB
MDNFKIISIKKSIYEGNDARAGILRDELKKDRVFLLNLMSSPGSGKTSTIVRTIEALKGEFRLGILEADLDSDVDARTIARTDTRVIQLHTGGMCHLDADMTRQGLEGLGTANIDLVILENVGNLICTAEFDTGAAKNAMILSVPEGDDKPLKYPGIFRRARLMLLHKIDLLPHTRFDTAAAKVDARRVNPEIEVLETSCLGEPGLGTWVAWIEERVMEKRRGQLESNAV